MSKQTITKNTTFLTASYIMQKFLSFFYFVLIARYIGVEDLGKYTFALSFTTMFAVFIDLGLTQALIRETAKFWDKASNYIYTIIGIKTILSFSIYVIVVIVINLMGYPPLTKMLVYLSGLLMVLDAMTLSFWGLFRGAQNLKYEAIAVVINQIIILSLGIPILLMHLPLPFLMVPFIVGSLFNFIFSQVMLRKKLGLKLRFGFDEDVLQFMIGIALPFALIAIFSRIYGYVDSVLLSYLQGDRAIGLYATAMKIPFALQFIPAAFAAAIFPAFSYYYVHNKAQLKLSFDKAMLFLTVIAVPISFGIYSIADKVILTLVGPEYFDSILVLQIMVFGLIFVFLNFPLGALMNSCDKQVTNTVLVGIVMVINIVANLIVIPIYSYIGAAVVFLFSHSLLFILSLIIARKIIPYSRRYLLTTFAKTILASVLMTIIVLSLKQYIHFSILILIGGAFYLTFMYMIRAFSKDDIAFLVNIFKKKKPEEVVSEE